MATISGYELLRITRCNCELGIDPDIFFYLKYQNLPPDTNAMFKSILCDNCFFKFFFNCKLACMRYGLKMECYIYILVLIKCDELKIEFRIILDWNYAHCEARPLKLLSLWSDETESIRLYLKIPIWVFFVTCWHPYLKSPRSWLLHMSSIIFKTYPSMSSHMKSSLQCLLIATCYKRKWNKWWLKGLWFLEIGIR